jgi:hypothetical protein
MTIYLRRHKSLLNKAIDRRGLVNRGTYQARLQTASLWLGNFVGQIDSEYKLAILAFNAANIGGKKVIAPVIHTS